MGKTITFDDIEAASARIAGQVTRTPCLPSLTLSRQLGCEVLLKFENLQFTASFKERGALNKLLTLWPRERSAGVVAMSAGNHAQGLAYHAARLDIPATIVMPRGTPLTKVTRTHEHGARVIVDGANLDEALAIAEQTARTFGQALVHPYDDPKVIAGQGTLGIEILEQAPDIDTIVVPIGGGGLISGLAIAAKAINPAIEIIGVQSRTYPSMARALPGDDTTVPDGVTIAEGIAVKRAGLLTRTIVTELVDEVLLVGETWIERAIALLQAVEKTVVEGAGAAALAAVIEHPERFAGRRVVVPLTGGNIDSRLLASVIMRDMARSGQIMRIEVPISDQPGALARLATILAAEGANIIDVAHDRLSLALNPKGATLELTVELQDRGHGDRIVATLAAHGFLAAVKPFG